MKLKYLNTILTLGAFALIEPRLTSMGLLSAEDGAPESGGGGAANAEGGQPTTPAPTRPTRRTDDTTRDLLDEFRNENKDLAAQLLARNAAFDTQAKELEKLKADMAKFTEARTKEVNEGREKQVLDALKAGIPEDRHSLVRSLYLGLIADKKLERYAEDVEGSIKKAKAELSEAAPELFRPPVSGGGVPQTAPNVGGGKKIPGLLSSAWDPKQQ